MNDKEKDLEYINWVFDDKGNSVYDQFFKKKVNYGFKNALQKVNAHET